jgi:hypothetical protein
MDVSDSLADLVKALVRLADAADRAVFLGEAVAVHLGVVVPEDVGLEIPDES